MSGDHLTSRYVCFGSVTEVEWVEVEDWCPENSDELLRNKTAFNRLQQFEMTIRRFIAAAMTAAFGDDWMIRQLPTGMLDSWKKKQQSAVKAGADPLHLIDYADFTDYLPIIERKDNWSRIFKSIFGRPEDIRESLQRLACPMKPKLHQLRQMGILRVGQQHWSSG